MLGPVINWYFKQRSEEFQENLKHAIDIQEELFQDLIAKLSQTEYGKSLGVKPFDRYEDFVRNVPVATYEELQPWIARNMLGEQGVLWPGDITWFAKSSGTTSNVAKYIPLSYESMEHNHYAGSRDVLTQLARFYPNNHVFEGKGILIGGTQQLFDQNPEALVGDLSAILMNHLPSWANWKSTPDKEIAMMTNWEEKVDAIAHTTIKENVTSISGVPTWTLVLFKRILEITGKKHIHEVWPNLELFIHGGVSFIPYKQQFKELLPGDHMHYIETYNASEGFFGVQAESDKSDLALITHSGAFFEFYMQSEGPQHTIPLSKVKVGVNYVVVISTVGGLWRYVIGDTIQFTSVSPYKFLITGRMKLFINIFGEELVIENAERGVAYAAKNTQSVVRDYTAAPVYMSESEPGHEWLIEFATPPSDLKQFTLLLDEELKNVNSDYAGKRVGDLMMKMLKVHAVPEGTFEKWLGSKGKLGGQNKVPRLSNDRKILEEILTFIAV